MEIEKERASEVLRDADRERERERESGQRECEIEELGRQEYEKDEQTKAKKQNGKKDGERNILV